MMIFLFTEYRDAFVPLSREFGKIETRERERDYITVTLISIVNTRTKLTLSLWKVWRMRKELDSRRREIDRVGNRWQYRLFPLPLSYNFKMPWKMKRDVRNVRISLDGVSLIIN